jgi:hypothetical protein
MYANFLGVDMRGTFNGPALWDYAPDFGLRANVYAGEDFFIFMRASGKYSTRFKGWGAQATIGVGWDFDK